MKRPSIDPRWVPATAAVLLAVLAGVVPASARKVEYVDEVSRTISVSPDVVLVLTNTSGDTEVTSWANNEIRIVARKVVRARSMDEAKQYADDLRMVVRTDGDGKVIVETKYPEWGGGGGVLDLILSKSPTGEIDYEIKIPAQASVVIGASSGDVRVEETGGDMALSVTSGDVLVSQVKGKVSITATSGEIDIDDVRGDADISATTGDVSALNVRGSLVIGVTSGDINCRHVEGPMELGGSSSSVSVTDCVGMLTVLTSSGDVDVEDHEGGVSIRTSGGYVNVDLKSTDARECDITTSSGDVELSLAETGSYEFFVESTTGEIIIEMPEEMDVQTTGRSVHAKYRSGKQVIRILTITGDIYVEAR